MPLAPSRLAPLETDTAGEPVERKRGRLAEPPILPPAALADDARFLRGTLTHALLEHLPGLPRESWDAKAKAFVAQQGPQLPAAVRKSIVAETLAVLRDPAFAPLFGPESRAEVAIVADVPDPRARAGASPRRQDRPSGARGQQRVDRRLQDQPAAAHRSSRRCRGLPPATCRLSPCGAAHLPRHAGQGCHSVDRRPANHGDCRLGLDAQQQRLWQLESASP